MIELASEPPSSPDAEALMAGLDAELLLLYPEQPIYGLSPAERARFDGLFLVARIDGVAVGCGAVRRLEPGVGEIKRMFVLPAHRGRGVARAMLVRLEAESEARGWNVIRLETGLRQPEAIALYTSRGFYQIPNYGDYIDDPQSFCMEKGGP